ncbi:Cobalamin synthase [Intestinimonas butyriciproducens]|uniref:Adenosylcobinamide-GDP ribazoletransferase n=2 Tax=Intestinimonas butyriciproducens TaxID=1297617 RepID=A0A0S2W3K1_9FIRM|nr:Cobalamin synthase [Intestinimonas butyriciproducens]QBB66070.1 Cobalamin synthase [Intestinimonas butyriciproducens]
MMRSLWIAVAMYSKLPVPQVEWDRKSLSWALCFFPVVGVVIGLLLGLWLELCALLDIGPWLRAAGALLLPVAVSGAIHLDGFCDTADALGSHQPREKKLEILKDSHTGAFAIICCCLYLITFFAVWCEAEPAGGTFWVLCLGPALSRSLSGLAACSWPNARGSGLLATFTQPMDAKRARVVLVLWVIGCCAGMLWLDLWAGAFTVAGALLSFLYYRVMSTRQFGGVTGDLAGFFLQICECAMVLQVVLAQRIEVLL